MSSHYPIRCKLKIMKRCSVRVIMVTPVLRRSLNVLDELLRRKAHLTTVFCGKCYSFPGRSTETLLL